MMDKLTPWYIESWTREQWAWCDLFSKEESEYLKELFHKLPSADGTLEEGHTDGSIRDSRVAWIPVEESYEWIYGRVTGAAVESNNKFFGFDLDYLEPLQLAVYNSDHPYYGQHSDYAVHNTGAQRKLTFSLPLSDPSEYAGGDLCLYESSKPIIPEQKQGRMIFFPSYMLHEVTPVTKGTRYSLVGWFNGPRFK